MEADMERLKQEIKEFFQGNVQKMYPWGSCAAMQKERFYRKSPEKDKQQKDEKDKSKKKGSQARKSNKNVQ